MVLKKTFLSVMWFGDEPNWSWWVWDIWGWRGGEWSPM